ncbi:GntR family transcriptional regulator [Mesorhizobium sp. M1A.F.Ca.ET.072.01.1.1]|uniref:GntR family transcriptional regulator n=1 Tax=unclassified Mesorhizobium TaxID=325217 RepID=UPI000FD44BA4|nr:MULTISPECIES: GntR family transcriptional regulator [unclassified Mesorhizobium]RUW53305.1 GntR family transcriptional regulator [Mesorhizobium sp. M1A.F.Ca.ET.072.01.1.1]TIV04019.1 MAG: GntR family transcriptional regulator [Mesorhizobium sp.]
MEAMNKPDKPSADQRLRYMYESIRQRIGMLHYPPGMMINEMQLANEFGVSRTPLRRVLQQLSYEGLVEIRNGVGTRVTDIDMKTFKDIYDLRILLAETMGSLSPNWVTDRHRKKLDEMIERARDLREKKNIDGYANLSNDLEALICDLIGSKPAREMTDLLYYQVARIWCSFLPNLDWDGVIGETLEELKGLSDALASSDVGTFGKVRATYLRLMLKKVSRYISSD